MQLALLTATVKLFLKRPTVGGELVPKVLKWATEEVDNPDCRDRGFMYWRLLSTDPAAARQIVLSEKPAISTETDRMDRQLLDQLLLHGSSLASIFHRQPQTFIRGSKARYLPDSPALDETARRHASAHLFSKPYHQSNYKAQSSSAADESSPANGPIPTDGPSPHGGDTNGKDNVEESLSALEEPSQPNGHADLEQPGSNVETASSDPYAMLGDEFGSAGDGYVADTPAPKSGTLAHDLLA